MRAWAPVLFAALLGGCATAVVTGAVQPRPPATEAEVTASSVRRELAREPALRNASIQVRVRDGVVLLDGTVPDADAARQAEAAARRAPGVVSVRPRLHVAP